MINILLIIELVKSEINNCINEKVMDVITGSIIPTMSIPLKLNFEMSRFDNMKLRSFDGSSDNPPLKSEKTVMTMMEII